MIYTDDVQWGILYTVTLWTTDQVGIAGSGLHPYWWDHNLEGSVKNLSGKYWINIAWITQKELSSSLGRWGQIYVTSDLLSLVGQTPFHKDAAVCPLQCHSIVHQCLFCTMSDPLASFPGCLVWEQGYQPTGNWTKWLLLLVSVAMCDQSFEKSELEQRMTTALA